jgi:hypothetical protein
MLICLKWDNRNPCVSRKAGIIFFMKKMESGLEELSSEELAGIAGGESIFFWIGYGIGNIGRIITQAVG